MSPSSESASESAAAAVPRLIETPAGTARLTEHPPAAGAGGDEPAGTLVLGHGAGGGIEAVDLVAVTGAARRAGWRVLLLEQPWRVAGKRVAAPPPRLDQAALAVLTGLDRSGPLVLAGRSAGARVACRISAALAADAVIALAFPLHPPGRPERSRADELALAPARLLVVQGHRDPFGTPHEIRAALAGVGRSDTEVAAVDGDHGLKAGVHSVAATVTAYLDGLAG